MVAKRAFKTRFGGIDPAFENDFSMGWDVDIYCFGLNGFNWLST